MKTAPTVLITGAPQGVHVQAVLPAATRTEIWEPAGVDVVTLPEVMETEELVDAARVGFDRRERVTIPPLHVAGRWSALDRAHLGRINPSHPGRSWPMRVRLVLR